MPSNTFVLTSLGNYQRHQGECCQAVATALRQEEDKVDHKVFGAKEVVWGKSVCIYMAYLPAVACFFILFDLSHSSLGNDARVCPAAPGDEHHGGDHRQIHSDQSRETPQRQVWWAARQTAFVSLPDNKLCFLSAVYGFFFGGGAK